MEYKDKRQAEVKSPHLITFSSGFSALKMDKGESKVPPYFTYKTYLLYLFLIK